ncbi:MAG: hypothetical protein IPN19_13305 [Elusimicrobia bacterium]|nr:hypothetical protein [Elusimicrobiota bacterium]
MGVIRKAGVVGGRAVFFFLLVGGLAGEVGDVEYVPSRDYAVVAEREINRAKSSVAVCLYRIALQPQRSDSPVMRLAESLRKAHGAGVRVEVFLDQNVPFHDEEGPDTGRAESANGAAIRFFRSQGIPVYVDDPAVTTHSKAVVIDETTVLAGSSNWTDAALTRNQETNILVRSPVAAKAVLKEIRSRVWQEPPPDGESVAVPAEFLLNPAYLGRMSKGDERALDVYLYLVREQAGSASTDIFVKYELMAETLGIEAPSDSRRNSQINKVLRTLKNRYRLIDFIRERAGEVRVTLEPLIGDGGARVPLTYWSQGWNRRLSHPAKSFFLISQYESAKSPLRPRWSAARKTMANRYHIRAGNITEGITELRRLNLVEVDYSPNVPRGRPRRASIYIPNSLYDPEEWDRSLNELKAKHGVEKVERAQSAARLVYEDKDLTGITALIDLENKFGRARVDAALKIVSQKNPDNPLRSLPYLIGTIKNRPTDSPGTTPAGVEP